MPLLPASHLRTNPHPMACAFSCMYTLAGKYARTYTVCLFPSCVITALMCQALLLLAVVGGGGATTAVAAQDALGSTPVAIGGSGLLLPYYTGATWALRKAGVIKPGRTRLSGVRRLM
jgi:hypothetical protein